MSKTRQRSYHTVNPEWLAMYAAGGLSPAKRLVIGCQAAIEPRLNEKLRQLDEVGGAFVETAKGEALSDDFWMRLSEAIEQEKDDGEASVQAHGETDGAPDWMPDPLKAFLRSSEIPVKWKSSGPGVERARLLETKNERLYLLKARPGLQMPLHSHSGQEWTLILQGGYHVGDEGFVRGDLHGEDETCTHQPVIDDDGEACISLVVDDGKLVFSDPLLKLLQPLIGI